MTACVMKIFSAAPVGFLAIARGLEAKLAAGGTAAERAAWSAQILNNPDLSQKLLAELVPIVYEGLQGTA